MGLEGEYAERGAVDKEKARTGKAQDGIAKRAGLWYWKGRMNAWKVTTRVSTLLCVVIGVPVLYASVYRPLIVRTHDLERREAELSVEVKRLEERLKELQENQARLETDARFVEKIAREELGYAKPGETIFRFVEE